MWIGTLALSASACRSSWARRRLRRLLLQGHDPRGGLRRRTPRSASIAFWLGVVAAFMTAFYSSRLMFMTFHGKYRARPSHHAPCPRIPAGHADAARSCWRSARRCRRHRRLRLVRRRGLASLLGRVDRRAADRARSCIDAARSAGVGEAAAAGRRARRHRAQLHATTSQCPTLPARTVRAVPPACTRCSTTSGISTSSTTRCSSSRRWRSAACFWKKGDGAIIDGLGPDGIAARAPGPRRRAEPLPDRLPLPLRLRHADRRGGAGHLLHAVR